MKFIMKQLRLFFPHLFPSYWIAPRQGDEIIIKFALEQNAERELLEKRIEGLEQKQELLMESFDKAPEIPSTPRCK